MKSLVLYDSMGGNTEKVARTIHETVEAEWGASVLVKVGKETELDMYDYDLVFVGSPVIDWLPTKKLMDYVRRTMKSYGDAGWIKPSAPIVPGKFGICFGTYGGPHIGKREALPMTMWLRSFLEHLDFWFWMNGTLSALFKTGTI